MHVLFVCTANICRSPFLELTARHLAGQQFAGQQLAGHPSDLTFSSAGTMGFNAHPMDEVMAGVLDRDVDDADASAFRSRPISPTILGGADIVLTAEREHRSRILEDQPALLRKVFTVGQFAAGVDAHPDLRGAELVAAQGRKRTAPTPAQDISDPYRRGREAAEHAAGVMTRLLRQVVPALVPQA